MKCPDYTHVPGFGEELDSMNSFIVKIDSVFINLMKLFDNVPHNPSLLQLNRLRCKKNIVTCITSFLAKHYQYIKGCSSSPIL